MKEVQALGRTGSTAQSEIRASAADQVWRSGLEPLNVTNLDRQPPVNGSRASDDDKATGIAASFIELYGPVAELQVSQRVLMFEADGNAPVVAAWRAVGEALTRLRAAGR